MCGEWIRNIFMPNPELTTILLDYIRPRRHTTLFCSNWLLPVLNAELLHTNDTSVTTKLLLSRADPNHQNSSGLTPLLNAVFESNVDKVRILLLGKADPNLNPGPYQEPLACTGNSTIQKLLLSAKADPCPQIKIKSKLSKEELNKLYYA